MTARKTHNQMSNFTPPIFMEYVVNGVIAWISNV